MPRYRIRAISQQQDRVHVPPTPGSPNGSSYFQTSTTASLRMIDPNGDDVDPSTMNPYGGVELSVAVPADEAAAWVPGAIVTMEATGETVPSQAPAQA